MDCHEGSSNSSHWQWRTSVTGKKMQFGSLEVRKLQQSNRGRKNPFSPEPAGRCSRARAEPRPSLGLWPLRELWAERLTGRPSAALRKRFTPETVTSLCFRPTLSQHPSRAGPAVARPAAAGLARWMLSARLPGAEPGTRLRGMAQLEGYYFSAALSCTFLVSCLLFSAFSRALREPYMDEIFHLPQAQRYCEGRFSLSQVGPCWPCPGPGSSQPLCVSLSLSALPDSKRERNWVKADCTYPGNLRRIC